MATRQRTPPQRILDELDHDYLDPYKSEILAALTAMDTGEPFDRQVELAGRCLKKLWENYSRKNIAAVLDAFPRVQRALFGLEEDVEAGRRYRDHYVHAFDVFITGSRIISQLLSQLPAPACDAFIADAFKVTPEPDAVPFQNPYTAKHRLFFLWTLIATFHDIGIPVQHLENIRTGLGRFLSFFGLRLSELYLDQTPGVGTQLPYYFDLMSRFYPAGVRPNGGLLYDRADRGDPYLYQALADAYGDNDHGVTSAVCLFNCYKETFLVGHHEQPQYDLTSEQYASFVSTVLEHDVARAALAIALHSIDIKRYPKIFPIDFSRLPLAFLLILCDELQEAFRLEGISFCGVTKLTRFPRISITLEEAPPVARIHFDHYYVNLSPADEDLVLSAAAVWAKSQGETIPRGYSAFLAWLWDRIMTSLQSKLAFDASPLKLQVTVHLEQPQRKRMVVFDQEF